MKTTPPSASRSTSSTPPEPVQVATRAVDVSVVIVNYNVREFLAQALRSVERAAQGLEVETFVVDNNSVDGSVEMVRREFPHVHLLANDRNVGFSRANNQAIREARGRYLLILNPDTILQEDTLRVLVDYLDTHEEAGAVGCQILNPDGTFAPESRRSFPSPSVAFYRVTGLSKLFPRSPVFGRYNMTFLPREQEAEVDALSGSCMMVRHAALVVSRDRYEALPAAVRRRVAHGATTEANGAVISGGAGLFDEDFFMYGEDLDWCYRIQRAGWSIRYTPHTRIIHYKGESTKKGDLRYVRLFYGAMLRFIEKHFQNRHSRLFALVLRLGIMGRALLTLLSGGARKLRLPFVEFAIVYACVTIAGALRFWTADSELSEKFLLTIAPGYALAAVAGIAAAGGYRLTRRLALRPVLSGALFGLLFISAVSFFVKDIAFSRLVIGLGFVLMVPALSLRRLAVRSGGGELRRALLVGNPTEAHRLQRMLQRHPAPPFALEGFVDPDAGKLRGTARHRRSLPQLGTMTQLRDLVRLRRIDHVIFAADGLPHASAFDVMHELRGLPVHFCMLVEGQEHLIGKASVHDLTLPALVELEDVATRPRSYVGRRVFELSVALPVMVLFPLLYAVSRLTPRDSLMRRFVHRARSAPAVVIGRRALVGYTGERDAAAAEAAHLRPAVFDVAESWPAPAADRRDIGRAYCFYARHQSAALDCSIMLRSIKTGR